MGGCLILALMHLLIWCRDYRSLPNLLFPVIAFGIIAMGACELALMQVTSARSALGIIRTGHLFFGIVVPASLLFIHFLFETGRLWLLLLAICLRTAAVVANYTTGASLHFLSIETIEEVVFLGESVSMVGEAVQNPWVRLGQLSALAQIAYVSDASLRLWRKGGRTDRRRAIWIGGSTALLFLVAMVTVGMISAGALRAPMLVSFPFFGMVLAISYEMSRELQRTALLAVALETSERRLSLAGSAGRLAFWEWDLKRDAIWISEDGWRVFGIERTEPLGFQAFMQHIHEADRERVAEIVNASVENEGAFSVEFRVGGGKSAVRWLSASGKVEKDAAGGPFLFRGVSIDVSEKKEAEARAALQRSELTLLARASTLGALSGSLAHELNQPLTAILGNAQTGRRRLGAEQPDPGEMGEILDDIIGDTKRAGGIVHGMRAMFSRDAALELETVDLDSVIRASLLLINGEIVARKGVVDFASAPAPHRVMGRIVELQQVVINLVLNGLDASAPELRPGESPRVDIRIGEAGGGFVQVEVADNGPGIPAENRERLFEPFFSTKPERGGLGLGLSISRGIVERFGGTLEALPAAPGGGAVFRIRLPVCGAGDPSCDSGRPVA